MRAPSLSGSIEHGQIPRIFLSLQQGARTGRLRLQREGVARDFCVKDGLIVWADSSSGTESLEWLLFAAGILSEERLAAVRDAIGSGGARGRALVETGRISPAALCEWTDRRARYLAGDSLGWGTGSCEFAEGETPSAGTIQVRVPPAEVVVTAIRETGGAGASPGILDEDREVVPEPTPVGASGLLSPERILPHEAYVEALVDGHRTVAQICGMSEIGEAETLKALALLVAAGRVRTPATAVTARAPAAADTGEAAGAGVIGPPADLPPGETTADMRAVVRVYNELYASVYAHLIKEVGPIADQYLEKHLREVRDTHASVLGRVGAGRGASLPEDSVLRSLNQVKDINRRALLVTALHDYLRAMVTAVRRILGTEHEAYVTRRLQEQRCVRI